MSVGDQDPESGLRELDLKLGYDSADAALRDFYVPVLSRSTTYDRSVGYFRASALVTAARGLSRFVAAGGQMRMLIGAQLGESERDALRGAIEIPQELSERLRSELIPQDEFAQRRLEVLGWLAKEGRLSIRVAVAVDSHGDPVPPGDEVPYFHEKIGILRDARGDGVAFQGSTNESATAWSRNFESFSVYKTWDGTVGHFELWAAKFEERWGGNVPGFKVFDLPEAVRKELIALAPHEPPPWRDVEEPPEPADRGLIAHFLLNAPRLIGSERLAEATSGVEAFPHQKQVVERLAGQYPRSWLLADEVGLGKTISAGLSLRRLLLSGEVERALILAPANVCRQWQDELFEKFGLWADRFDDGKLHGVHPEDVRPIPPGQNLFEAASLLIVSSHLARREAYKEKLLEAREFDLVIVDEAHHARQRGFADLARYRPGRLMQLLDQLIQKDRVIALWLLTATPMQVHALELRDLLKYVGLEGALATWGNFELFFRQLATATDGPVNWQFLATMLEQTQALPADTADLAVLSEIERRRGPVMRALIERFGKAGESAEDLVKQVGIEGRADLLRWIRQRSPIGQLVTRHSRETLRIYRNAGLLNEPLADRDPHSVPIVFTPAERELYDELDVLLDRLTEAHGNRKGAGFVLNVYRRRLTSSWEAIHETLRRRLERETLELELDLLDEADIEDADTSDGAHVDDVQAVPLTEKDLDDIREYVDRLELVSDSKYDQLVRDLNEARGSGQAVIVFTQFTDTLLQLRDYLTPAYGSQLATYTGDGGRRYREGQWKEVSKQELVEAVRAGTVTVLLANDAASEGLNLQACSFLINYDLPYNPMRVEQRIGRIDRIGQQRPVVTIKNYVIPDTVEERVYAALAGRIDLFHGLVGNLQPILGATEDAFKRIFRAPRSERKRIEAEAISELMAQVDQLKGSGIDFQPEDPMPIPDYLPSPVRLAEVRDALAELDITLDAPGRPTTFDSTRASRDAENWAALGTFGHPKLSTSLREIASSSPPPAISIAAADFRSPVAIYRSDRTPPEPLQSMQDLSGLGQAIATGDAESAASLAAETARAERLRRQQLVLTARKARWNSSIRSRFIELVNRTIEAEIKATRTDGEGSVEPRTVWLNLTQAEGTAWQYAETFRLRLGLGLADLAPDILAYGEPIGTPDDLRRLRRTNAQALLELMDEFRAQSS